MSKGGRDFPVPSFFNAKAQREKKVAKTFQVQKVMVNNQTSLLPESLGFPLRLSFLFVYPFALKNQNFW
jgi:hypothetical protein